MIWGLPNIRHSENSQSSWQSTSLNYSEIATPASLARNDGVWRLFFFFLAPILYFLFPDTAQAGEISDVLCKLTNTLSGPAGKAIATVAVAAMGIGALLNKVSWNMVFVTCFGLALIIGSSQLAEKISPSGNGAACGATAATNFSCDGATPKNGTNIFSVAKSNSQDTVDTSTSNYDANTVSSSCYNTTNGNNNIPIFATMMCVFKSTIGDIMSNMYCSFADYIKAPLASLLVVFVSIFGIMMITGMTNTKVKDFAIVLFKIALIWTFATGGDWAIGVGYKFFMSMAQEGSDIAMLSMPHLAAGGTPATLTSPDTVLAGIFNDSVVSLTSAQHPLTSAFTGLPAICIVDLTLLAVLFIFFLPGFIIFFLMMLIQYIGMFAKAMLNYLTALVLISFLFILAPLFISFALFRTTAPIFEKWLQFLGTFAIQMIVMFGFLAMLSLIPTIDFYVEVLNLLKAYDTTFGIWHFAIPIQGCGFCDYTINSGNSVYLPQIQSPSGAGNQVACIVHNGSNTVQAAQAGYLLSAYNSSDPTNTYWVSQIWTLMEHHDLVMFLVTQIIALYLIGKVMEDMLNHADKLAKALGGVGGHSAIASFSTKSGQGAAVNYVGLESIAASYHGAKNAMLSHKRTSIRENWRESENMGTTRRIFNVIGKTTIGAGFRGAKDGLLHGAEERVGFVASLISGEEASLAVQAQLKRWEADKKKMERAKIAADAEYKNAQSLTLQHQKDMDLAERQLKNARTAEEIASAQALYDKAKANYSAAQANEKTRLALKRKADGEIANVTSKMEMKRRSVNWHRGFIGDQYSQSSLKDISTMSDTETAKAYQELRSDHIEKQKYGRILKKNPDNRYYGILKMPKDVPADIKNDPDYVQESASGEEEVVAPINPTSTPQGGGGNA